jgi:hypothetical protein
MSETVDERLSRLRNWRGEMKMALEEKIARTKREREEVIVQYDEEIGALEAELRALGVPVHSSAPNELVVKAYNYLLENAGRKFSGRDLMRAVHAEGAVPSILLAPMIQTGKIKREGEYRSTVYWAEQEENQ